MSSASVSSASVSSAFSNDISETAVQIKTKLLLGPPWGGGGGGGSVLIFFSIFILFYFIFFSLFVNFEIILRQQNNCFTPCWSIVKHLAIGVGKDKMNY